MAKTQEIREILRKGGTNPDILNLQLDSLNKTLERYQKNGYVDPDYLNEKLENVERATMALTSDVRAWARREGIY